METVDMYMHITRIGNTIMDARVSKENKDIVINIMKDLKSLD